LRVPFAVPARTLEEVGVGGKLGGAEVGLAKRHPLDHRA
jgi:hypothetical protein